MYNRGPEGVSLEAFCDADRASKEDHGKCTSGNCFKLSDMCASVSWSSRVQGSVATSTAEVVTVACVSADLFLYVDNQASIALSNYPCIMHHGKSKHL